MVGLCVKRGCVDPPASYPLHSPLFRKIEQLGRTETNFSVTRAVKNVHEKIENVSLHIYDALSIVTHCNHIRATKTLNFLTLHHKIN